MRIVTDRNGANPKILDDNGNEYHGFSSVNILVTADITEATFVVCGNSDYDIEPRQVKFEIFHPITDELKRVKKIIFDDGEEWEAPVK